MIKDLKIVVNNIQKLTADIRSRKFKLNWHLTIQGQPLEEFCDFKIY